MPSWISGFESETASNELIVFVASRPIKTGSQPKYHHQSTIRTRSRRNAITNSKDKTEKMKLTILVLGVIASCSLVLALPQGNKPPTSINPDYRFPKLSPESLEDCTCKVTCVPIEPAGCNYCGWCSACAFLPLPQCGKFCRGRNGKERKAFCQGVCTHGSPGCALCAKKCPENKPAPAQTEAKEEAAAQEAAEAAKSGE